MELKYNNIDYLNESISVLPQEDKEKLKSILSENFYKKGEIISSVKEIEEHIYIISQGGARVFYLKDGKEITFHSLLIKTWSSVSIRKSISPNCLKSSSSSKILM